MARKETVAEFLKRGGQLTRCKPDARIGNPPRWQPELRCAAMGYSAYSLAGEPLITTAVQRGHRQTG